jgi:hypothetical protein
MSDNNHWAKRWSPVEGKSNPPCRGLYEEDDDYDMYHNEVPYKDVKYSEVERLRSKRKKRYRDIDD